MSWVYPTFAAITNYLGGVPCDVCPRTDPPDMLTDTAGLSPMVRTQLGLRVGQRYVCHGDVERWFLEKRITRAAFLAALGADHPTVVAHAWRDYHIQREPLGGNNLNAADWAAFQAVCIAAPGLSGIGMVGVISAAMAQQQAWTAFLAARAIGGAVLGASDQAAFATVWAAVRS